MSDRIFEGDVRPDFYPASGGATHSHPDDVLSDPALPIGRKREILASWLSDARAVENAPALRRLDIGAFVTVDAIMAALRALDEAPNPIRLPRSLTAALRGRRDDDPPPAPVSARPPRSPRTDPDHGEALELPALMAA